MDKMMCLDNFFCDINAEPGLYGLHSVPGLGKQELIMYISHMIVRRNKGKPLIITELSEKQWKTEMGEYGLSTKGITIIEYKEGCSIRKIIKEFSPTIIFIHLYSRHLLLTDDQTSISRLKDLSLEYSVSIVLLIHLYRNSGDNDPVYRRPQLYDLIDTYPRDKTIGEFTEDMRKFNAIVFLHRCHDWYRNIGIGHAFHICNEAELMVFKFGFSPHESIYFDFSQIIEGKVWE